MSSLKIMAKCPLAKYPLAKCPDTAAYTFINLKKPNKQNKNTANGCMT